MKLVIDMKYFEYNPSGVCSKKMKFEIDHNIIKNIEIIGGCSGNSLGIISLCKDQSIDTIIEKLKGIKCGFKTTSCPDQLARALENYKEEGHV